MDTPVRQVFQANSPNRSRTFIYAVRISAVLIGAALLVLLVALSKNSETQFPKALDSYGLLRRLTIPDSVPVLSKQFRKTRKELMKKPVAGYLSLKELNRKPKKITNIKAAFYVNWDNQSFQSLKEHITELNMVLPEWFFVGENSDTVITQIDQKALLVMKHFKTSIVPVITNFSGGDWDGDDVHRIISNPALRKTFIQSILTKLKQYGFKGINIDFEELNETTDDYLVAFQKELYQTLHKEGFLVTQDIIPNNADYDPKRLVKYNDYLFLMAYDQHHANSDPGPIASIDWVENLVDRYGNDIPSEKLILGIATYGYDWTEDGKGRPVTYQEALTLAKNSNSTVKFDTLSNNLHFAFLDSKNKKHRIFFNDAASTFNTMRLAANYELAGTSFWRLGSEDSRIWNFYYRNLTLENLKKKPIDLKKFSIINATNQVDFIGNGEFLDVLSEPRRGFIEADYDSTEGYMDDENYQLLPSSYVIERVGHAEKKIVLTFDDGPSKEYTPQILHILQNENVPAAFFMVGINAESNLPLVKKIYDDGFEIGNHTFTHPDIANVGIEKASLELNATRRLIECVTGHSTVLFRPPYNADYEPHDYHEIIPIVRAKADNYITVGESIDPNDWQKGVTADSIVARVIRESDYGNILLLHDAGGNRQATVEALPRIIRYFRSQGYTFTSLSKLVGQPRSYLMPPLDPKDLYISRADWWVATALFWFERIIFAIFIVATILSIARLIILTLLAYIRKRKEKYETAQLSESQAYRPPVSIIVPAYNEEVNIVGSIKNLLSSGYPNFEIILVDDGSKDMTYHVAREAFEHNPKVKILTKPNGGKASALNYGILHSSGEIMVCIDADTQLRFDAVTKLVESFSAPDIAAVAGNVKVGNEVNLLTKWQSIEYITSQNFDRRAFDLLNCITVVPGAIGAFRKSALLEAGMYTTDTIAEDCDITIKLLKMGYRVVNNNNAIAYTEAPETVKMFLRQRFRWNFGIMQSFWKHRDAFLNNRYKSLGWVALPNILIFQLMLPTIAPLADLVTIIGILFGNGWQVLIYYLVFLSVELLTAAVAFSFEHERKERLVWLIPQRFYYRQIMYYVAIKSIIRAIKGELMAWGVLKRTGNVQVQAA